MVLLFLVFMLVYTRVLREVLKTCDKRGGFMPSYTELQRLSVIRKLEELDNMAYKLLPGKELEVAWMSDKSGMRYLDHALVLTHEGLFYKGWCIEVTKGFFGRTVTSPARQTTRVNTHEQRKHMIDLFDLGPSDLSKTLDKLADPYGFDADREVN